MHARLSPTSGTARWFDAHDVRAQIGEQAAARLRLVLGQLDDPEGVKGQV
jgi:hypothetical protein